MDILTLKVEERKDIGKNHVKKLRNEGYTPAVIYGPRYGSKGVQAKTNELNRVLMQQGFQGMLNLEMDDEVIPTIIKDVQNDMLKGSIIHVDFQHLSQDEKIRLDIPIILRGREAVEDDEKIVQQQLANLEIQCYPRHIPQEIIVDVSTLVSGEALTIAELDIMDNEDIEVLHAPDEVIAALAYAVQYDELEDETEDEDTDIDDIDAEEAGEEDDGDEEESE